MIEKTKEISNRLREEYDYWTHLHDEAADTIDMLCKELNAYQIEADELAMEAKNADPVAERDALKAENEQLLVDYRESVNTAVDRGNQIVLLKAENERLSKELQYIASLTRGTVHRVARAALENKHD